MPPIFREVVGYNVGNIQGNVLGRTGEIKRDEDGERFVTVKEYVRSESWNKALRLLGEEVDGWSGKEIVIMQNTSLQDAANLNFSHFFREKRKKPTPIEIYRKDQMAPTA